MKSKQTSLYLLMFCYIFFSFAVYIPDKAINIYGWLKILFVSLIINLIYILLGSFNSLEKYAVLILKLYLVFTLSRQIYKIYRYMKIYHSSKSGFEILIITGIIIFIFVAHSNIDLKRYAMPLFIITLFIPTIVLMLNVPKISRYNIYNHGDILGNMKINSITMFDYCVPIIILSKNSCIKYKSGKIITVILSYLTLLTIVLLAYSCFNGNYMYSISPLQCLFQLSGTNLIRNYDALFTFFIIFSFFASVIIILLSFQRLNREISCNYKLKEYGFLFLLPVFFIFNNIIKPYVLFFAELVAVMMILMGKKNEKI